MVMVEILILQDGNPEAEVDIQFKPIVQLPPVQVSTLEEDEDEVFKMYVFGLLYCSIHN